MTEPIATDPEDLRELLARVREETAAERWRQFPTRALAWLALLPEWTGELAAAVRLGGDESGTDEVISAVAAAGGLESRTEVVRGGGTRRVVWMRSGVREEVGAYLRRTALSLHRDFERLTTALRGLERPEPELAQWLHVALTSAPKLRIVEDVDRLVRAERIDDAWYLIGAAQAIGEVLGDSRKQDAQRAQWRLDRRHRTERDEQALSHYVPRAEIETAIDDLVRGDGTAWALHLLGDGGVGKTMAVRYLASGRYAAEHDLPELAVARVDFDHLDPRYPEQRPGQLFLALAEDLRGFAGSRDAARVYDSLNFACIALHEALAGTAPNPARIEVAKTDVVRYFARYLSGIDKQVVLVLDTCEELAKLYAPGASAPAVDRTFDLLHRLRDAYPRLRVLLAGRRWLTRPDRPERRAAGPVLAERAYVRVVRIGGFDHDEACRYCEACGLRAPRGALRDAVLARIESDGAYNPFDLAAYCSWASSDPELTVRDIETGSDPYVQQRIIGRIAQADVRAALPAAVEFGRFDLDLIEPALRRAGVDPRTAFGALAGQEWVETVEVQRGLPRIIEVDDHLRDRIRHVLDQDPAWSRADRGQLARDACEVVRRSPRLDDLSVAPIEAAVRLLEVADAAEFWHTLEQRVVDERAWGWAAQVADRAAAVATRPGADGGTPQSSILAAIRATQAATRLHLDQPADLGVLWQDAQRAIASFPKVPDREALRVRIALGICAAGGFYSTVVSQYILQQPDVGILASTPSDALLAAAETVVGSSTALQQRALARRLLDILAARFEPPALTCSVLMARAVLLLREGGDDNTGAAVRFAAHARSVASHLDVAGPPPWLDWVPPRDLDSRAWLTWLLARYTARGTADGESLPSLSMSPASEPYGIDSERLLALTVRVRLSAGPIDPSELRLLRPEYVPGRGATHWLHTQVPPLAVEVARAWDVANDPYQAEALLRGYLEDAVRAGDDPDVIEQCQLGLLRLCRVHRTLDFEPSAERLTREGSPAVRTAAWQTLALVTGERPMSSDVDAHTWWTCQDSRSLAEYGFPERAIPNDSTLTAADRAELRELGYSHLLPLESEDAPISRDGAKELDENAMRLAYLRHGADAPTHLPNSSPGELGRTALEAGELLALRLPGLAVGLLTLADSYLRAARDYSAADRAMLLAALAAARAGDKPRASNILRQMYPGSFEGSDPWLMRRDALDQYLVGGLLQPAFLHIPEIDFPEVLLERQPSKPNRAITALRRVIRRLMDGPGGLSVGVLTGLAGIIVSFIANRWLPYTSYYDLVGVAFVYFIILGSLRTHRSMLVRIISHGDSEVLVTSWRGPISLHTDLVGVVAWPDSPTTWLRRMLFAMFGSPLAADRPTDSVPFAKSDAEHALSLSVPRFPLFPGRPRLTAVQLEIDRDLEDQPWERRVVGALPKDMRYLPVPYRMAPMLGKPPTRAEWRKARGLIDYRGPELPGFKGFGRTWPVEPDLRRVALLVGTSVDTSAGWRFRIADDSVDRRISGTSGSTRDLAGGELFAPSRSTVAHMACLVLQAEPIDGLPQRFDSRQYAGLVRLAGAAIDAGAGTVLVIPPVSQPLAEQIYQLLYERIALVNKPLTPTQYLALVKELRELIAGFTVMLRKDGIGIFRAGSNPEQPYLVEQDLLLFLRTPPVRIQESSGGRSSTTDDASTTPPPSSAAEPEETGGTAL